MSTMSEAMSYFDPSEVKENVRLVPGKYLGHISKATIKNDVKVRGKYMSNIYNYYFKVSSDNAENTYQVEDISGATKEYKGDVYEGKEVRSNGVFHFIAPTEFDEFEANPGGNKKYFDFVQGLDVPCKETEVEVDGKSKTIYELPNLAVSDIVGKPVIATLNFGKPWKGDDGVERKSLEVKHIIKWEGGTIVDAEVEDLPF
jgi:hypothetical protein